MHKLKKSCGKVDLKEELLKINQVCTGISSSIKTLEKRDLPASDVGLLLQTVLDLTNEVIGQESAKLNACMDGRHPAISYWNEVPYFDPTPTPLPRWQKMQSGSMKFESIKLYETLNSIPMASVKLTSGRTSIDRCHNSQRTRFTEENLGVHLRMCFNNSSSHTKTDDSHTWNMEESPESLSSQLDGGSDTEADIETEAEDEIE
ncbi:unnamed protein product [Orchesella dallaii]|uniref:Uncharacterized protein n=1 Tax=Orchesella dallaii TaxID=48710 RepID=A0ABP1QUM8_9HEXA